MLRFHLALRFPRPAYFALGMLFAAAASPVEARASGPLGDNGAKIQTSNYTLDLYEGPVLAGSRVVGLAGAYVPIAEGVAGFSFNPAASAVRVPWSVDWFDWDLDGGVTFPSSITNTDFDNNGDESFANSAGLFLTGGANLQFGNVGVGVELDIQRYGIRSRADDTKGQSLDVTILRPLIVGAYAAAKGQLVLGLGLSAPYVGIEQPRDGQAAQTVASVTGVAVHLGGLWAPHALPLRAGVSVRLSPPASWLPNAAPEGVDPNADGDYVSEGYYLPRTISLPTEVHAGVAFQLFRPMNPVWINPHDQDGAVRHVRGELEAEHERRRADIERRRAELQDELRRAEGLAAEPPPPPRRGRVVLAPQAPGSSEPAPDAPPADPQPDAPDGSSPPTPAPAPSPEAAAPPAPPPPRDRRVIEADLERLDDQLDHDDERAEGDAKKRLSAAKAVDRTARRAPYLEMPREKVLVSAAVKMTTITTNGVGLESFLRQRVERSGETVSFSPRLGLEGEAIPGYLVLRGGSYYEPTRFRTGGPRVHGTGGLDVRIPINWSVFGLLEDDTTFRVGGAVDAALRYFGWTVTAGLWH